MKGAFLGAALMGLAVMAGAAERTMARVGGVTVTSKSLAQALGDYVSADLLAKGGSFIIEDPTTKSLVKLRPTNLDDGAHLHQLAKDRFLSWGEFVAENGDAYLLDFYFEWKKGRWALNAPLSIYSKNKVKRYDWDEKGAYLKRLEAPKAAH